MKQLLLHPRTRQWLQQFKQQPPHALLLVGPAGSGKDSLASHLSVQLMQLDAAQQLESSAHYRTIEPAKDKRSIGIEAIRELQLFTKLKLPDPGARRVIVLRQAHSLTAEAQNALLKVLEEPPERTHFMLLADSEQQLLPTIRSRTQVFQIHRPSRQDADSYFQQQGHEPQAVAQAYFLGGGLPGLMSALLADQEHPLKQSVQQARQILQMTLFERLCQVESLSKDKAGAQQLLFVLQSMARAALEQAAAKATPDDSSSHQPLRRWHGVLRASYEAEQAYAASAQAKLALTRLMLAL